MTKSLEHQDLRTRSRTKEWESDSRRAQTGRWKAKLVSSQEWGFHSESPGEPRVTLHNYLSKTICSDLLLERWPTGRTLKLTFFPSPGGTSVGSLPQCQAHSTRGRGGQDALTTCGEEAHLPQEEGGVHMAQGLLHVPEAGARRQTRG